MSDDLVQRLRDEARLHAETLYYEAADRVEALIDDVAHEKEYLAEAEDLISQHYQRAIKAEKRIEALEAALQLVADHVTVLNGTPIAQVARRALDGKS